jgi:hypothetical protein
MRNMVVFFGIRAKRIAGNTLHYVACSTCGNQALRPQTVYSFVHIFWVPVFPYKREIATECMHCKSRMAGKEVPPSVHAAIKRENKSSKPPVYLFAGAILVASIVAYAGLRSRSAEHATADYMASPLINDYYVVDYSEFIELEEDEYLYGIFKVWSLEPDSIRFRVGTYGYKYINDAGVAVRKDDVSAPGYFYDDVVAFSLTEMQELFEEKHVKRIIRRTESSTLK